MARIAEDLMLLLLDNAAGRPGLDRERRERVLGAAVLLDLAHACRLRPAIDSEPVKAGALLVLAGPDPGDAVLDPALAVLRRRPMRPSAAVATLRRGIEPKLLDELARAGQIRRMPVRTKGFGRSYSWPFIDRTRVNEARAALLTALFDGRCPTPSTAAIILLLHAVNGFDAVLSLNERGWRWVEDRANEITGGSWVHESGAGMPEVNLAVTASAVRPALA